MKHFALLLFVAITFFANAANPEIWFAEGNARYQEKQFADAIIWYDSIVDAGFVHAETFYNLGNAHYRLGHVGSAILNFERALKANPADEDAKHNLALANKRAIDQFAEVPIPVLKRVLRDVTSVATASNWTLIALVLFVLSVLAAALFFFKMRSSKVVVAFVLCFVFAAFAEGLAFAKYNFEGEENATITTTNTYVKSAPGDAAADLFILHEGTKLGVLEHFENWLKVKLPDGKIGWLPAEDISII